jgi:hypothetical protein
MNWRYKIELMKVLRNMSDKHDLECVEEPCPEEVKTAIVTEIEKAPPLRRFTKQIRQAKSIAAVNRILNRIYDEADQSAVWCGL